MTEGAQGICVLPDWHTQPWYPRALQLLNHTYLSKWNQYCRDKNIDVFQPGVTNGIEKFPVSLYKSGLGYSAINTARSALSEDGVKFGEHPLVVRCMKGIFELKPALPKYSEIWDGNIV